MNSYAELHYSPILPMSVGLLPAVTITALLVWLMHSLISSDEIFIEEESPTVAEIVWVEPKPIVFEITTPPTKPKDPLPEPELQLALHLAPVDAAVAGFTQTPLSPAGFEVDVGVGGGGIVAYLKPAPIYPSRAITKGIEGYVDLAFDIVASGSTAQIRVIDAQPEGVFERAAVTALKKWKYKVPVIDGVPQGQVDMMTRMTFTLENG